MAFFGSRILALVPLVALPIVTAADVGSIALVHLSVPDHAGEAARAGMAAIQFNQGDVSSRTAQIAYDAAASVTDLHREGIDRETFTIYKNGSVKLTVRKTAPTLMAKYVPVLSGLTHASATTTVRPMTW